MNNKIILRDKKHFISVVERKKKNVRLYFLGRVNLLVIRAELGYDGGIIC